MHSLRPDLTRNRNQRCAVTVGIGSSRDQIRCARSQSRKADTRLAGQPPVHIRHECRALLVPHDNDADRRLFKRPHHIQILFPRNAENVLDAFIFQTFHQHLCRRQLSLRFLCCFLFFFHDSISLLSPQGNKKRAYRRRANKLLCLDILFIIHRTQRCQGVSRIIANPAAPECPAPRILTYNMPLLP